MDKASLLASLASQVKEVEIAALGGAVKFRAFSGRQRDAFYAAIAAGDKSNSNFEASIVAASVVNDDGSAMFTPDDIEALRDNDASLLTVLAQQAMTINKIGLEAETAAAKN